MQVHLLLTSIETVGEFTTASHPRIQVLIKTHTNKQKIKKTKSPNKPKAQQRSALITWIKLLIAKAKLEKQ